MRALICRPYDGCRLPQALVGRVRRASLWGRWLGSGWGLACVERAEQNVVGALMPLRASIFSFFGFLRHQRWSGLSEQQIRNDKWIVCRG
jgi:hypothetical protein